MANCASFIHSLLQQPSPAGGTEGVRSSLFLPPGNSSTAQLTLRHILEDEGERAPHAEGLSEPSLGGHPPKADLRTVGS